MVGISPTAIAVAAGDEVRSIFRDALETLREGEAQYLVGGEPTSITGAISQAAGRSACRIYGTGNIELNPTAAEKYERVCRPYLDTIAPGQGASIGVPFDGGQCDAQVYLVTSSVTTTSNGNVVNFSGTAFGPIGGVSIRPSGSGEGLFIRARGYRPTQSCGSPPSQLLPSGEFQIASFGAGTRSSPTVTSVTACGFADTCGNPPPEVTQPGPISDPQPPPFRLPPGPPGAPDVDVDIDVELFPDGTINFNIGTGPITIDPFGDGDGDGGGDGGAGGPAAPGPPSPGPESPGGGGGAGQDDGFGEPPDGERWVGVCLRITATPSGAGVIPQSVPEDVYPTVVGNARLVYAAGAGRVVDTPVQIRAKGVCLWESVRGLNPVAVNVDLLPGYSYAYRPYSVPEEN